MGANKKASAANKNLIDLFGIKNQGATDANKYYQRIIKITSRMVSDEDNQLVWQRTAFAH